MLYLKKRVEDLSSYLVDDIATLFLDCSEAKYSKYWVY